MFFDLAEELTFQKHEQNLRSGPNMMCKRKWHSQTKISRLTPLHLLPAPLLASWRCPGEAGRGRAGPGLAVVSRPPRLGQGCHVLFGSEPWQESPMDPVAPPEPRIIYGGGPARGEDSFGFLNRSQQLVILGFQLSMSTLAPFRCIRGCFSGLGGQQLSREPIHCKIR